VFWQALTVHLDVITAACVYRK